LQSEMQITKIAYAKAWCMNGFGYYVTRGPLVWFVIVAATFTIISFFSENPPTLFRIFKNLIVALMEQNLTKEDLKSVRMKMEGIRPFKEIIEFVIWASILCILFGVCLRFFI